MALLYKIKRVANLDFVKLQFSYPPQMFKCPLCNGSRLFIRTHVSPRIGTRCLSCLSTAHHRGIQVTLQQIFGGNEGLGQKHVYELSAHGALYLNFLRLQRKNNFSFMYSEYLDGQIPGKTYNGVRCEDIQNLTFADETFDLITSTGVMEHVEDDEKGFSEVFRVLRSPGYYLFTVPFSINRPKTIIRARRDDDGNIINHHPPEYHGDPFRGEAGVFTWRNYGTDILGLLNKIGFDASVNLVELAELDEPMPVIVAKKRDT